VAPLKMQKYGEKTERTEEYKNYPTYPGSL